MTENLRQADAIEITPAMIEAGVLALRNSGRIDEYSQSIDYILVIEVVEAVIGGVVTIAHN